MLHDPAAQKSRNAPNDNALNDKDIAQLRGILRDEHLEKYEQWLDSKFRVPGTSFRVGLDGVIGLIPGVGDMLTTGVSGIFIADALRVGARKRVIAKMGGNIALDFLVGLIPFAGDLLDFAFKSNTKNLRLLRAERERLAKAQAASVSSSASPPSA